MGEGRWPTETKRDDNNKYFEVSYGLEVMVFKSDCFFCLNESVRSLQHRLPEPWVGGHTSDAEF